jgi:hypothetical protein
VNRIVRRHYPTAKLPDDLRDGLDIARKATVTIELEESEGRERPMTIEDIFAARQPPFRTRQEIDDDLRMDREDGEASLVEGSQVGEAGPVMVSVVDENEPSASFATLEAGEAERRKGPNEQDRAGTLSRVAAARGFA